MSMTYSDHFTGLISDIIWDKIHEGDKRSYELIEIELLKEEIDKLYNTLKNVKRT